jgi:hypothetical protein
MRKELQEKLYEKYPKIFPDPSNKNSLMCWGLICGDGWFGLIDTLCMTVQGHLDWQNCEGQYEHMAEHRKDDHEPVPQLVAVQVKEKFGTLRFYCMGGDEYSRGVITVIENMSARTCEGCGNPGEVRRHSWVATRCQPCEEKWKIDNAERLERERIEREARQAAADLEKTGKD